MQSQGSSDMISNQKSSDDTAVVSSSEISSTSQDPLLPPPSGLPSPSDPMQSLLQASNIVSTDTPFTTTTSVSNYISSTRLEDFHDNKKISHQSNIPFSRSISESASEMEPEAIQIQPLIEVLRQYVMNGDWDYVIREFENHGENVQTAKITRSNETALHVAISDSKADVVRKLVDVIGGNAIQKMTDDRDENPLHLAATLGQTETCKLLVDKDPELIGTRNKDGETPLFLAARHGKKRALYTLHPKCPITGLDIKHDSAHCRRNDGNTILHVSVLGGYFDLAFQIIHWYPELIMSTNEKGQTALHLLAENPSAFRSGCHLGPIDDFIYRCLIVDAGKVKNPSDFKDEDWSRTTSPIQGICRSSFDLVKILNKGFNATVHWTSRWKHIPSDKDVEKQQQTPCQDNKQTTEKPSCQRSHIDSKALVDMISKEPNAANRSNVTSQLSYNSASYAFLRFVQFTIELLLTVLGLGFFHIHDIKSKKMKHIFTYQLMEKIVPLAAKDAGSGTKPLTAGDNLIDLNSSPPEDEGDNAKLEQSSKDKKEDPKKKSNDTTEAIRKMHEDLKDLVKDIVSALPGKQVLVEQSSKAFALKAARILGKESSESPFLIAAKMGVVEIVRAILKALPTAIHQEDENKKNAVLLAVENKHPDICIFFLKEYPSHHSIFQKVDKDGNSVFHLAATKGENETWRIPGIALQIQWELKWYKFITTSKIPQQLSAHQNKAGRTSREEFNESHKAMVKEGIDWLTKTSESCSLVAALIASVAYASATTVPGGVREGTGLPLLRGHLAFNIFSISSLVALCLSVTSLTMFLSILTSRYQISDFLHNLPTKLILGLTSLFVSIAAILVSFCAGHFFDLGDQLRRTAFPIYAITRLPVSIYAVTQFPLYFDLIRSIVTTVPKRDHERSAI